MIEITDLDRPELSLYADLNEPQLRGYYAPAPGLFIAETENVIARALSAGYEPVSFLVERRLAPAAERLAGERDVPVFVGAPDVLKQITGYGLTHGILSAMRRRALPDPAALLGAITSPRRRVAVLEGVVNPTNVGAIFRSAAALGMDAVLHAPRCADPLQRRAVRVSMGTVFQVPWTFMDGNWIGLLRSAGFRLAAMALAEDAISLRDARLRGSDSLAVILGTEGEGLQRATMDAADFLVTIPMHHGVDSLNVAAASAVAFWELGRPLSP